MRHVVRATFLAFPIAVVAGSCSPSSAAINCPGVAYVSLFDDGSIVVNGQATPYTNVAEKLGSLTPPPKFVAYYREDAGMQPTAIQDREIPGIMRAITQLKVPVSLSSKADFSDNIDGAGASHPVTSCPAQG